MSYCVYSPSYGRPTKAITHKLFRPDRFYYVVHEEEEAAYRQLGVQLKVIPKGNINGIAVARNWILDNADSEWFIQCDDDITKFTWLLRPHFLTLTVDHLDHLILSHFQMAEDMGIKLWGMNVLQDPKAYRQTNPYVMNRPILGPFSAMIKHDLRYDTTLYLKEDYDMFLQIMNRFGSCLRANFLFYYADHLSKEGGCQSYRTEAREREQQALLQKKWGSQIVRYNEGNPASFNMRIRLG